MNRIVLPGTDVSITPIAFGTWAIGGWLWGGSEEKKSIRAIESAIDLGMTTIDTAPVYGFGQSESFTGKAIRGKRSRVQILTKFGLRWDIRSNHLHNKKTIDNEGIERTIYRVGTKESIIKECEDSLKRLGTDYIDLYQQHWPDKSTPAEETMEALDRLKQQGKIRAGGASNYSVEEMAEATKYFNLVSDQVPYSMVLRDIEKELVPWCIKHNKAIIAYSPMQRGLLTGKITSETHFKEGDHRPSMPFYQEPNLGKINQFLDEIKPVAKGKKATLAQIVLKWTLKQPGIYCVLAGARSEEQTADNVKAAELDLTAAEMKIINTGLNKLNLKL